MKKTILLLITYAIIIISLISFIREIFLIISSEYIMICSQKDKEFIQKIIGEEYNFKIALVDVKGFLEPSSEAKIILCTNFSYPNTWGKQKTIEKNPDNIKSTISLYVEEHSNKIIVSLVCILPYVLLYSIISFCLTKIKNMEKGSL